MSAAPPPAFAGMQSLPAGYRAAAIGASGAIGGALAAAIEADPRAGETVRFARSAGPGATRIDLTDEASVEAAAASLGEEPLHLLLIATGALTLDGAGPEKALGDLDPKALAAQVALNAIGPALVLKHFAPRLARRERVIVAALSARVGSIEDNRLGGWHGYRASKAALNQILRTAAIELARSRPESVVAALHPGTVESPLSRPFRPEGARAQGILTPAESAARLLGVLDGLSPSESGAFWDWRGERVPW